MGNVVRAAIVQTEWTGDKDSMLKKNIDYARDAANDGAQAMCFQELFYSPYFCSVQENEHFYPGIDLITSTAMLVALSRSPAWTCKAPQHAPPLAGSAYPTPSASSTLAVDRWVARNHESITQPVKR